MPDKPVIHGGDHRPGGQDPSPTGPWHYVLESGGAAWNSGTNYSAGDIVGDDTYNYVCVLANGPSTHDPKGNLIGAFNPGVTQFWPTYWVIDQPLFQGGWINSGGSYTPMRYKLAVGAPNSLDINDGSVSFYSYHTVMIQGSVTGGNTGTTIFSLPPAYRPDSDLHISACNNAGNLVVVTVQQAGNVIDGFV